MSVKSKHSSTKKDKLGKKEKKKKLEDSEDDIESSEEELDLTKECHPIGYYMNDRTEMINQMFSVIKGNKLKALLPPTLKDYDIDQLKLHCLDQLLGMSEKRITCILEGEPLETSSESEVAESDEYDSNEKNGTSSRSSSERSEDSQDGYTNNINNKHKKRKANISNEGRGSKMAKKDLENPPPEKGKTLLEILELEMRARAIRALLKQSGNENSTENNDESKTEDTVTGEDKEISGEVVDLTACEDDDLPASVKRENSKEAFIDEKVSTFEEKIEKSQTEKSNQTDEKSKKLQAELELRNKLFKKKSYRTRQQRMENEDKSEEKQEKVEDKITIASENIVGKNETVKEETKPGIVPEDTEEGEINSSEDENCAGIKEEVAEPEKIEKQNDVTDNKSEVNEVERIAGIDNGEFVNNCNLENVNLDIKQKENENSVLEVKESKTSDEFETQHCTSNNESSAEKTECEIKQPLPVEDESNYTVEETSWRDRWLQKDGVQKLVKSSKILAKVKKRIAQKTQRVKEENSSLSNSVDINSDSNSNSKLDDIKGSIEEYEKLISDSQGN